MDDENKKHGFTLAELTLFFIQGMQHQTIIDALRDQDDRFKDIDPFEASPSLINYASEAAKDFIKEHETIKGDLWHIKAKSANDTK